MRQHGREIDDSSRSVDCCCLYGRDLMLAQYLLDHRQDAKIKALLDSRDIWVVPMVNPDGAEFDIATGRYQW